jgi:C1A family cysteine protease
VLKGRSAEGLGKAREHFDASRFSKKLELSERGLPFRHENTRWCSPIEDQGPLGSCTAQAVVGLVEFMQRRHGGDYADGSRLFLYKVSRNLLGWTGDSGAYIRTALKAAVTFGVPPERFWPYDVARFEEEPTAFLYSYAREFQALNYARLDDTGLGPNDLLNKICETIAAGLGIAFGFTVYSSINNAPDIPMPTGHDTAQGGHAVMAVGYDDAHVLADGTPCPSLIIRNSWGPGWGIGGYGFLPYDYVLQGLSCDFWTVLKTEWLPVENEA